jgi:hypothetical protein
MKIADNDVVSWYNSMSWPQTVKSMRESLLSYLGIAFESQTLTNDSVQIPRTIDPATLKGRDVLFRICEINAGFGHITRIGMFKVIQLTSLGLYPSETLFPAEDLFPAENNEMLTAGYKEINYEEYIVEPITALQISGEDGDVGVTVGEEGNAYIISENFLLYGKTGAELTEIANNILLMIKNKYYRPHNTVCLGLPYVEVGDALTIITSTDAIETFIFTRTLKGIQALEDEYTATGNQKRSNTVSLSTQVQQLQGRTLKITKNVDQLSSDMSDLAENVSSQFEQTAKSIGLKVDKNGVIAAINVSEETVQIDAANINLNGVVTANGNFKILTDGSMEASNGLFSGDIVSAKITASEYSNVDQNNNEIAEIKNGVFTGTSFESCDYGNIFQGDPYTKRSVLKPGNLQITLYVGSPIPIPISSTSIIGGDITCNNVNGYPPINTDSISRYSSGGVGAGGSLGLFQISNGGGYISYNGAAKDNTTGYTYIGAQTVQAASLENISLREAKENIKACEINATELICKTPIYNYTLKDNEEDTKVHTGVIIDEAPEEIVGSGGNTVLPYDMGTISWKAIQEINKRLLKLETN